MGFRRDVQEGGGEEEGQDDEGRGVLHDAHDEVGADGELRERNHELKGKVFEISNLVLFDPSGILVKFNILMILKKIVISIL